MTIARKRWVIIKDNKIFCGLARNYKFKPIDDIGDTAIKPTQVKRKQNLLLKVVGLEEKNY